MGTPVFNLTEKHSADVFNNKINKILNYFSESGDVKEEYLNQLVHCLSYKVFFCEDVEFMRNNRYTVSEACQYIHGMFRDGMIEIIYDMLVSLADKTALKRVLRNCLSFELLQMLYNDPVRIYAAFLTFYARQNNNALLTSLALSYLQNKTSSPTLAWEKMYLVFMEMYENEQS